MYKLFRGLKYIGEYESILLAKNSHTEDGVYNLISSDKSYRDSWQIVNGILYN